MKPEATKTYRPEKEAIVEEIRRDVTGSAFVFLADFKGVPVSRATELRRRLRPVRARVQVVPNRLFLKAVEGSPAAGLKPALRGSTAMIFGAGDPVETAKVLTAFTKETQLVAAKGGVLEGSVLSAADVAALAALPSKQTLQGMLVGALVAPLQSLVGVLNQKLASLIYVLKAVEEKKAKSAAQA